MTELSIESDAVVLGAGATLRVSAARLSIAGSRISSVIEPPPVDGPPADFDLRGRLIAPAFINGHTHLAMSALRGIEGAAAVRGNVIEDVYFALESELTPADIRAFTRLGAYESVLSGVGCVWDHYYSGRAVADGLADVGLAGVVAPTLQDGAGPGAGSWERALADTVDLAGDDTFAERGVSAALGPHATDTVSDALWEHAVALAHAHELPVHAHLAQSWGEYRRSTERFGCSPLARLHRLGVLDQGQALLVHALFTSAADLALLDPARHVLGYCPFSQLQFGFAADAGSWTAAGVPWLVASDCAASNDSMDVQKELRFCAGLRTLPTSFSSAAAALRITGSARSAAQLEDARIECIDGRAELAEPAFLLSRVWSVPGRLHPRCPAGELASGALANLLVLDPAHPAVWPLADPLRALAYASIAPAIDGLLVAGRWIGERGRFHASIIGDGAYREALAEATDRRARLLRRLR